MYATVMAKLALLFVLIVLNQHEVFEAFKLNNPLRSHYRLYKADVDHLNGLGGQQQYDPNATRRNNSGEAGGQHFSSLVSLEPVLASVKSEAPLRPSNNLSRSPDEFPSSVTQEAQNNERDTIKPIQMLNSLDGYNGFERSRMANPFLWTWRVGGWDFGHGYRYKKGVINGENFSSHLNSVRTVVGGSEADDNGKRPGLLRSGSVIRPRLVAPDWTGHAIRTLGNSVRGSRKSEG